MLNNTSFERPQFHKKYPWFLWILFIEKFTKHYIIYIKKDSCDIRKSRCIQKIERGYKDIQKKKIRMEKILSLAHIQSEHSTMVGFVDQPSNSW